MRVDRAYPTGQHVEACADHIDRARSEQNVLTRPGLHV